MISPFRVRPADADYVISIGDLVVPIDFHQIAYAKFWFNNLEYAKNEFESQSTCE